MRDLNESMRTNRGYTYDDLNQLVNAEYGEDNFSTGIGRYNERLGYDGNSNVTSLQRKGVTQEGSYGLIDDLRLCYDGNQLSKVEENAPAVLYAGSLDVKRSTNDIRYNANGSLTMDGTRDITHIDYDLHNNLLRIQFANGNVTKYVYSAAGEKLRAIYYTTETYTLNSHGSGGSLDRPANFSIGTDVITPETDFSSLCEGLCGHFVFIGACNVGSIKGRGYELVENMARQTKSTVIASGHPLRAGYKYDGSNYLNEMPIPYRMDSEYQFNNYIISEKGDLFKPISNVTIDKDKGINWKNMDIFSKLPIFRY